MRTEAELKALAQEILDSEKLGTFALVFPDPELVEEGRFVQQVTLPISTDLDDLESQKSVIREMLLKTEAKELIFVSPFDSISPNGVAKGLLVAQYVECRPISGHIIYYSEDNKLVTGQQTLTQKNHLWPIMLGLMEKFLLSENA